MKKREVGLLGFWRVCFLCGVVFSLVTPGFSFMFKLHLMFSAPIFWRIPPQQGWAILSLEYCISYSRIIWHLSYIVISRQYRDIYTISKFVQISDFFSFRWQTFVRHLSHFQKCQFGRADKDIYFNSNTSPSFNGTDIPTLLQNKLCGDNALLSRNTLCRI